MRDDAVPAESPLATADAATASFGRRVLVATGLTALAVLLGTAMTVLGVRGGGLYRLAGTVVLAELGFVLVASLFLGDAAASVFGRLDGLGPEAATAAGLSRHVGTALPAGRLRTLWSVLGWSVGLAAFAVAVTTVAEAVGVPLQPVSDQDSTVAGNRALAVWLALSIFVIAPAEEGFFRGFLQTYLGEAASARGAVLAAAALFALVHVPQHLGSGAASAAVAVAVVFVVGATIGIAYEQSGSLPVAIGIHACYNCLLALWSVGVHTWAA